METTTTTTEKELSEKELSKLEKHFRKLKNAIKKLDMSEFKFAARNNAHINFDKDYNFIEVSFRPAPISIRVDRENNTKSFAYWKIDEQAMSMGIYSL
jgi:hypothetical protein